MPMLIPRIDAIARSRQRDVLYIEFRHRECDGNCGFVIDSLETDWRTHSGRRQIIRWLDAQGIDWLPCGYFAGKSMHKAYCGQLYIDIPCDPSLPAYQALKVLLENPDGSMRLPDTAFCVLPLGAARRKGSPDIS